MSHSPVHRNSLRNFRGTMVRIASLSQAEQLELLKRFDSSMRLKGSLEQWLNGRTTRFQFSANEYNYYLKEPLNGTYYRFFAHLDKVDRLWEVTYETER